MVYTNKLLWEFLLYKREWNRNKDVNIEKQKERATRAKLNQSQKPTGTQIDERVDRRFDSKMDSPVKPTVQNILADNLISYGFKEKRLKKTEIETGLETRLQKTQV